MLISGQDYIRVLRDDVMNPSSTINWGEWPQWAGGQTQGVSVGSEQEEGVEPALQSASGNTYDISNEPLGAKLGYLSQESGYAGTDSNWNGLSNDASDFQTNYGQTNEAKNYQHS